VGSGQFLIDSESNIEAALARMDSSSEGMEHDHGQMDHRDMDGETMNHSQMDHGDMEKETTDHSQMDHSEMEHDQ
jgi:Cu(I)/Ag(I) efflux system membrane fusion protein